MELGEEKLMQEMYLWYHNTYVSYRGYLCYNLNNSRNKIDGMRNKSKGLQAGRSDFVLYGRGGVSLMIEVKTEKGVQSVLQKEWQEKMENFGYRYVIVRSLSEFKKVVEDHLGKD